MGFDYSHFKQYQMNFIRMTNRYNNWLKQFMQKQGDKFIRAVKPRTPVDTGALRGSWKLDTPAVIQKGRTFSVWFVNEQDYASFVEYGHAKPYKSGAQPGSPDWVDGFFMMTVSKDEVERELPAEFDADFRKFLKELGVL